MHQHQERRQQEVLTEHLSRMETQPVLTDLPLLPAVPMAGDCSTAVTEQPGKESAPKATSTQIASSTKKQVPRSQKSSVQARKGALAATTSKTSLAAAPSTTKTTNKKSTK